MANESPFIPPFLPSPRPPPGQQPVIPEPSNEPAANLAWGGNPQHPGAFPIYPSSPFQGPGYQPPLFPTATPGTNPSRLPPTLAAEYVGYPAGAPMPPGIQMAASPWYQAAQLTPWSGMQRPQGQPLLQPPNTAPPFQGYQFAPHPSGWPSNQYGQYQVLPTPAGYPLMNFPYVQPSPTWETQPGPGFIQQNGVPQNVAAERSSARVGDRVDPFMAGSGCMSRHQIHRTYHAVKLMVFTDGPVLDPFEVQILQQVQSRINPLLEPLADTAPDRPHLKWNMLFRSNDCYLSTDASHVSWSKGRDEPATFPRLTKMTIISEHFPWTVPVEASNPAIGVTCGDVIDQLSTHFYRLTSKQDYEVFDQKRQAVISQAYRHNRSREPGVPGGTLKEGIRRLDYLGKDFIFGGIYRDDQLVFKLLGTRPSCHYVLKCLKQYALTAQEAKEHQDKQREFQEKEREERRREDRRGAQAGQATVEDAPDSDDGR
ncbi:hypothetical protein C0993_011985 [Termitomyces sp. T159_Od127]|nr:hypothetical protein C0993_011985 [Termitomyces sp. T159_Od127]